ncbi:interferon-induced protein with tetratricopeptide repeats 2-like [Hypomesus transpacificus]|uniref:interferon-induced protein with tetratricopeptide repeats 2-like n=1 Tax=Hypomesus transpacificus TaxID=137520 RepID=UPI001F0879D8|nr:interferon-induced protein with tetratricopeptide repeats 2-like [Hypomesus transpacificus]
MSTPETALKLKLEKLECHFTWGVTCSLSKLNSLRDHLEDIKTDEGYTWLGHIYNLLGFIRYRQGCTDSAVQYLRKAGEAFLQINNTVSEEGPWLLVNYGNLAWMNFHLNNMKESQDYLEKVEAVMRDHPPPSQEDPLHPEVYAEKAWTLMKFGEDKMATAIKCFQKAIAMEPDRKEWQTSHVLALDLVHDRCTPEMEAEILEKLKRAKEVDQENTYLAAVYLLRLAKSQKVSPDEIRALAGRILCRPCGAYSGLRPLLRVFRICLTQDEAIDLVQEALDRNPDDRYLKDRLATSYRWKVLSRDDIHCSKSVIERSISLFQEVIALYPESCLKAKLDLASIYAKSGRDGADEIYEELLDRRDLGPAELQMLHNPYAQYLHYHVRSPDRSINHHMEVVKIQNQSNYRSKSVKILSQIVKRKQNRSAEMQDFLKRNSATQ